MITSWQTTIEALGSIGFVTGLCGAIAFLLSYQCVCKNGSLARFLCVLICAMPCPISLCDFLLGKTGVILLFLPFTGPRADKTGFIFSLFLIKCECSLHNILVHVGLPVWHEGPVLGPVVHPHVFVLPVSGLLHHLALLLLLEEQLGQVSVVQDPSDLPVVLVFRF